MALRTPLSVTPHLYMGDSTGRPLDMGTVYFGEQDKDPEFYPINLFSDDALTKPLAQPVHTKGGYLYDKGDMVELHAKEIIYSVKVLDSYGRKVFYKGAMMRNSWNDDVIQQINEALMSTAEQSAQIATDVAKEIADKAVVSSGFVTIDSFEFGATITQRNQALRHTATGKLYRWAGDLPKTVAIGSTPESSGGIAANAWLEISDTVLRQELSSDTNEGLGALMVAGANISTPTVASLLSIPTNKLKDNQVAYVVEYEAGSGVGGGEFEWDSSSIADIDNGIVFGDVNETGRWIRVTQGERTKSEWYAPTPVTDGARFIANSTNKNITYSKDNSFYKKLLFKIEKPFDSIKAYYPNVGTTTQKCFIEWDRGIFWMSFYGGSGENRMIIAAVDITTSELLTVTAISSTSLTFEVIKEGASRHLYVRHAGGLKYIDVTTLPEIGVDVVATPKAGLEKVYANSSYYDNRWYSFEITTREEVSASAVKVYKADTGALEMGFVPPQVITGYDSKRKFVSKEQSIRIIGGEIVYAVGAGSRRDALLSDGGVSTAANRLSFYQGLIRCSLNSGQITSSLVDPLAYKDVFNLGGGGVDKLVETQDVTALAGGGLASIVNDDDYVYIIEEFASSADARASNFESYQATLPNLFDTPFDSILQTASSFGVNNIGSNNLTDVFVLDEVTSWVGIIEKMIAYGAKTTTLALHPEAVLDFWFDDFPVTLTGNRLIKITLRGNSDIYIDYTSMYTPELATNKTFTLKGHFYLDATKASGLKKGRYLLLERLDTATKQMLYATTTADLAWKGISGYTGV